MKNWLILLLIFPLTVFSQKNDELIKKGIDTDKYIPKGIEVGIKAPVIIAKSVNGEVINTNEIIKEKKCGSYFL